MFEHLKKWPRILVTGPQRSGTRIAATMIAHDLNYWPIYEETSYVNIDSLNRLWHTLETGRKIVVQCPALSCNAHLLAAKDEGLAVVMMRRNLEDIKASEERIRWRWEMPELIRLNELNGNSANVKYFKWDLFQKEDLGHKAYEVDYNSLERHELWIAKPGRARFGPRQTS